MAERVTRWQGSGGAVWYRRAVIRLLLLGLLAAGCGEVGPDVEPVTGEPADANGPEESHLEEPGDTPTPEPEDRTAADQGAYDLLPEPDAPGPELFPEDTTHDAALEPDADDAPVDTGPPVCAPWAPDGPKAFELTLGTAGANLAYLPVAENAPIEVTQGPQGGVHLVIAAEAGLAAEGASKKVTVEASTFQPCCASDEVASFISHNVLLKGAAGSSSMTTIPFWLIFDENEGEIYADDWCCVVVRISLDDETESWAARRFYCVDETVDWPPPE